MKDKNKFGQILQTAAPALGLIPGVGSVASTLAGVAGSFLNQPEEKLPPGQVLPQVSNPYMYGGRLKKYQFGGPMKQYNAPPHSMGGMAVDPNGNPSMSARKSVAEVEKREAYSSSGPGDGFVFSDEITLPDGKTVAQKAAEIEKKYGRYKDEISKAMKERELARLAKYAEKIKAEIMQQQQAKQEMAQMEAQNQQSQMQSPGDQAAEAMTEEQMMQQQAAKQQQQGGGQQMSPEEAAMMEQQAAEGEPQMKYGGKLKTKNGKIMASDGLVSGGGFKLPKVRLPKINFGNKNQQTNNAGEESEFFRGLDLTQLPPSFETPSSNPPFLDAANKNNPTLTSLNQQYDLRQEQKASFQERKAKFDKKQSKAEKRRQRAVDKIDNQDIDLTEVTQKIYDEKYPRYEKKIEKGKIPISPYTQYIQDDNGRTVNGPDGNPITDKDGNPIKFKVDAQGNPIINKADQLAKEASRDPRLLKSTARDIKTYNKLDDYLRDEKGLTEDQIREYAGVGKNEELTTADLRKAKRKYKKDQDPSWYDELSGLDKTALWLKGAGLVASGIDALQKPEVQQARLPNFGAQDQYFAQTGIDSQVMLNQANLQKNAAMQAAGKGAGSYGQFLNRVNAITRGAQDAQSQSLLTAKQYNDQMAMARGARGDKNAMVTSQIQMQTDDINAANRAQTRNVRRDFFNKLSQTGTTLNQIQYMKDAAKNQREIAMMSTQEVLLGLGFTYPDAAEIIKLLQNKKLANFTDKDWKLFDDLDKKRRQEAEKAAAKKQPVITQDADASGKPVTQ